MLHYKQLLIKDREEPISLAKVIGWKSNKSLGIVINCRERERERERELLGGEGKNQVEFHFMYHSSWS